MLHRPTFKPHFQVHNTCSDGTFLLSEHGHFVLFGPLNELVAPEVDGRRTADQIVDDLEGRASAHEIYYALALLEKQGYLAEADEQSPPEAAAFWSGLGLDPGEARQRIADHTVAVDADDPAWAAALHDKLARLGVRCGADPDLTIVVAGDYLDDRLAAINRRQLERGRPWLLVKPRGFYSWLGPLFVPGAGPCYECLAQRLRANREVECFVARKRGSDVFRTAIAANDATLASAAELTAIHTAIFLAAGVAPALRDRLVTTSLATLTHEAHPVVRRPQCPACGDPHLARNADAVTLRSSTGRTYVDDGGRRGVSPEVTYERYKHLVSPVTGVVTKLTRVGGLGDAPLHVYSAGHNFALKNDSLYFLREGLRTHSSGKGRTDAQARTSALCEAIERYSGVFRGDESRLRSTFRALGSRAIHPNDCMRFSAMQYAARDAWLARRSRFQVVPVAFDDTAELEWTPLRSLTTGESRYLPTGYLYYGYPLPEDQFYFWADSNGNAAGNTVEEAILQGFLELVERDAVCLWWYNRVPRPALDLASLGDPHVDWLVSYYREHGREFWVLDVTSDLGIPAFAAINRRVAHPVEDIVLGFGAHLDPRIAAARAIAEMNQFIPAVLGRNPDGSTAYAFDDAETLAWWRQATLANQPYLRPLPPRARTVSDFASRSTGDVGSDVAACVDIARRHGLETLVLNQTRPDIGLPVVKVVVPGLRHFWARFGPGRLYDAPVRLGWLPAALPEAALNPIPMFV